MRYTLNFAINPVSPTSLNQYLISMISTFAGACVEALAQNDVLAKDQANCTKK